MYTLKQSGRRQHWQLKYNTIASMYIVEGRYRINDLLNKALLHSFIFQSDALNSGHNKHVLPIHKYALLS